MKKADFLKDVEHEIRMLKKYATKEELSNMDLGGFDPSHPSQCIYGQATGSCTSVRAKILMDKSCVRVFDTSNINGLLDPLALGSSFSSFKPYINGANKSQGWEGLGGKDYLSRNYDYLSALEGYILMKDAKIKMIISFLKGESNKLKL